MNIMKSINIYDIGDHIFVLFFKKTIILVVITIQNIKTVHYYFYL